MAQNEIPLSGFDAIVSGVVRSFIPDLATRGFEFTQVEMGGSPQIRLFPMFYFANQRTELAMDISFHSAREGRSGGFGVSIFKSVNYNGVMNVEKYLKQKGHDEFIPVFTYRDPEIDIHDFAERFMQTLITLLDTVLKPVVEGAAFEVTPIDWMGYK